MRSSAPGDNDPEGQSDKREDAARRREFELLPTGPLSSLTRREPADLSQDTQLRLYKLRKAQVADLLEQARLAGEQVKQHRTHWAELTKELDDERRQIEALEAEIVTCYETVATLLERLR